MEEKYSAGAVLPPITEEQYRAFEEACIGEKFLPPCRMFMSWRIFGAGGDPVKAAYEWMWMPLASLPFGFEEEVPHAGHS